MEWSSDIAQADWIRPRLSAFSDGLVTSVVPGGFEAYARVFHPASRSEGEVGVPVRWSEVAAWSGLPLNPKSQFPDIALPEHLPADPAPWDAGPEEGTLHPSYAMALANTLSEGSDALPWWFCVWDGFGWDARVMGWASTDHGAIAPTPAELEAWRLEAEALRPVDPVPHDVRNGPRVRLPNRDYLFYRGDPPDALAFVESERQTANLWWPSDHSWCVATEIDLPWTYVGGSADLVAAVVSDPRLEALVVSPRVSNWETFPSWVSDRAELAAALVRRDGRAVLETPYGTVRAALDTDERGDWVLTVTKGVEGQVGHGSSGSHSRQPPTDETVVRELARSVADLLA